MPMSPEQFARHLERTKNDSDTIDRMNLAMAGVSEADRLLALLAMTGEQILTLTAHKEPLAKAMFAVCMQQLANMMKQMMAPADGETIN